MGSQTSIPQSLSDYLMNQQGLAPAGGVVASPGTTPSPYYGFEPPPPQATISQYQPTLLGMLSEALFGKFPGADSMLGGIFAGPKAATANQAMLKRAQQLDFAGASPKETYIETGWFKGSDGHWRFEIDDSAARLAPDLPRNMFDADLVSLSPLQATPAQKVAEHESLFSAYPQLKDIAVLNTPPFNWGLRGAFDPDTQRMYLAGGNKTETLSTLLHEMQHAVQRQEGWQGGGNMRQFLPKDIQTIKDALSAERKAIEEMLGKDVSIYTAEYALSDLARGRKLLEGQQEAINVVKAKGLAERLMDYVLRKRDLDSIEEAAFKQYESLPGEVEARITQERQFLRGSERKQKPPWISRERD